MSRSSFILFLFFHLNIHYEGSKITKSPCFRPQWEHRVTEKKKTWQIAEKNPPGPQRRPSLAWATAQSELGLSSLQVFSVHETPTFSFICWDVIALTSLTSRTLSQFGENALRCEHIPEAVPFTSAHSKAAALVWPLLGFLSHVFIFSPGNSLFGRLWFLFIPQWPTLYILHSLCLPFFFFLSSLLFGKSTRIILQLARYSMWRDVWDGVSRGWESASVNRDTGQSRTSARALTAWKPRSFQRIFEAARLPLHRLKQIWFHWHIFPHFTTRLRLLLHLFELPVCCDEYIILKLVSENIASHPGCCQKLLQSTNFNCQHQTKALSSTL